MPISEPVWLSGGTVDAIHHAQIKQFGGSYGTRDAGLIESALARPQRKWEYEEDANLPALAAAYGYGLAKNHGYIDGNKRVALVAMFAFLDINGWQLNAPQVETVGVILRLAAGALTEEELAAWLRANVVPFEEEPPAG